MGVIVKGADGVLVRLAKCCTPVPGDEIAGYISLGKGVTIHRLDCPNVRSLMRNPERFTEVEWSDAHKTSFRANIVSYGGVVEDQLAKNWYVAEVGDIKSLRSLLSALRNVDAVFDAFRVTPS